MLVIVNVLFLFLGALLYMYANKYGIAEVGDALYGFIAKNYLGAIASNLFFLGIIAAAYSSADSALTSLTTSFCFDILDFDTIKTGEIAKRKTRMKVHLLFSLVIILNIYIFKLISNENVIDVLFKVAGYTYGPLLGLFAFGILTKYSLKDRLIPLICTISPIISWLVYFYSSSLFNYKIGYETLIINAFLTFLGLLIIRKK